ncbi:MAG: hypothetical protein E2O41_00555 [Nitrospina sp.]|nr:MAG: hypothetical protein E2O41_00555 [Nitrospina sp.]
MKPFSIIIRTALLFLLLGAGVVSAQFFEQKDIFDDYSKLDYDKIFEAGLSRNGQRLNLSGKKIGDKGVALLLSHEVLKKVTALDLRYNEISEKGARLLAESQNLTQLKKLELKHNYLLDAGAVLLAGSKGFPKLQKLSVGWNEIRDEGALAFARSQNFPKLKILDIRGNFLANKTKETLRKNLAHLKSLKLF